jgi:hypothetical protein
LRWGKKSFSMLKLIFGINSKREETSLHFKL